MAGFFKPVGDFFRKIADRFTGRQRDTRVEEMTRKAWAEWKKKHSHVERLQQLRAQRHGFGGKQARKAYADGRQRDQKWRCRHGLNYVSKS